MIAPPEEPPPVDTDTDDDPYRTMTRATDPGTSHQAAHSWTPEHLTEVQLRVAALHKKALPDGLTHEELHDRYLWQWPTAESSPRKRCCDLTRMGLVKDSGRRRPVRSKRMAIVWVWVGPPPRPRRLYRSLLPPPPVATLRSKRGSNGTA